MVMELDVEQLLEAPFRKPEPEPQHYPAPTSPTSDVASSSGNLNREDGKGHHSSGGSLERKHRSSSSRKDRRRSTSRSRSPTSSSSRRERSHRDDGHVRSSSHRDGKDRDRDHRRRHSSRSRSPQDHRRRSSGTDRRRSRSRDYSHRRRGSPLDDHRNRKPYGGRDNFYKREASPELSEYERDKRTVFVMQLAARLKQEELFEFFAPAGKVRDARIIADRNSRRSKGVGYVEFVDPETVPLAIAMTGQKLCGLPIIVQHTESEKNRIAAEAEANARANTPITRLYVGSLHFALAEEDLAAVFAPFGAIERVDLHKDSETGRSRGFAFVHYQNAADAKQAMDKMNGFEIMGRAIKVGHSSDKAAAMMPMGAEDGNAFSALDDGEMGGLQMNNQSRMDLMAKLAREGNPVPAVAAKPIILPTRNILLKNMFNLLEAQTETGWEAELKDDVSGECSKYGSLRHVGVDTEALDGRIYLRYDSIPQAEAAVAALNGRFFAGNKIEAAYVPDISYNGRFPEAAFQ